jgi:hypothetical protein
MKKYQAAISLGRHIIAEIGLRDENYLLVDSGNGSHIYIPVEDGVQAAAIKAATEGIKTIYEDGLVEIDTTVSNPSRLMRASGSMNCKGAIKRPCVYLHCPDHLIPVSYEFVAGLRVEIAKEPQQKEGEDLAKAIADKVGYTVKKSGPNYLLKECPFCHNSGKSAVVGRAGKNGGYYFKCHHKSCKGKKWADLKDYVGVATNRLDKARKLLKEQGKDILEMPEFQAELSKLKALGDLHKLEDTCKEVGIE